MSAKSPRIPSYCVHIARNQAYVRLGGQMIYLGVPNTPDSRERYERAVAEWLQAGRVHVRPADKQGVSVNEVLLAYRQYAGTIYVNPDGTPTKEVERINLALRKVMDLYGLTPASQFGPKALVAVQDKMAGDKLARITVNQRVHVIRRAFKWAARQELIPVSVFQGLQTVEGLRRGRTQAAESIPVNPVADTVIAAVTKFLPPTVRAMVALHDLTGMRSGELVIMRTVDLDMSAAVWTYRPSKHKTQHHGHDRPVRIGPQAQELLRPFLNTDVNAYIFSPARARDERAEAKRALRKTKVQPSQANRRSGRPQRTPGHRYTTSSYRRALEYATTLAIRAGDLPSGTHWHPHQLRHNAATRIRRQFGLDTVRAVLGHRTVVQSAEYAELDSELAAIAASAVG